ncbi:U-box domain-containing protein 26 [Selaginella moellendorffii]|uniref:U-box domain-containing protein 26 n=1 Tax=Selaginella moellendorffii TaxID=88036 RepID=UPI000D1CBEF9|nr:U-box domain-containing protein 26 [Selaginella moellendorffii]XP_024534761.1 U-box domain-containing protein 26 [Selaginella moellendorffii]|eukprot:XP_024529709.1 U-box domain-containing protein 26 [Selaginella moellendorffii]
MPGLKKMQVQNLQVPHYFRCPISLELMRDPVTVATGQTYDRSSIEKWVSDGNATCPATMQRLTDLTLIPNHTLRRLIQEWCVANRSRGIERIPTPKQPADPQRVAALVRDVTRGTAGGTALQLLLPALRSLRALAKENDKNRGLMVEANAVSALIRAMFRIPSSSSDDDDDDNLSSSCSCSFDPDSLSCCAPLDHDQHLGDSLDVEESSLAVLVLLPLKDSERRSIAQCRRRLGAVSRIVRRGRSMDARINAAVLVEKIASDAPEAAKLAMGQIPGLLEGLVDLLRGDHSAVSPRAPKSGVKALFSLCLCSAASNSERAVSAGAAAALVEHLPAAQHGDADRTLGALELLCRTRAGREVVAQHALAVPALVAAIQCRSSFQAAECAAGTLLAVCSGSEEVQLAAAEAGVLTQLLLLIQSDCTDRAKRKAVELLKLLRRWWAEDPCLAELDRTDVVAF